MTASSDYSSFDSYIAIIKSIVAIVANVRAVPFYQ